MKIRPGDAVYKLQSDGSTKWNVPNKDLAELARYWYNQCAGLDGVISRHRKIIKDLIEKVKKLEKRKKKK